MSLRIYTNVQALIAHNNLSKTDTSLSKSIERMSSGLRINHAADDAAGSAIVADMTVQTNGLNIAAQNAQDGVNMLTVIDGALSQAQGIVERARNLAVQMSNGTYNASDRQFAQNEVSQLMSSLDQLGQFTNFNGVYLLSITGGQNSITFQTGAYAGQTVTLSLQTVSSSTLSINAVSVGTANGASTAIVSLDNALNQLSSIRATFGAAQSRMSQIVEAAETTSTNLQAALSHIRDLDVASETTNLSRLQIMQQAGISVLSTANQSSQSILSLIR